MNTFCSLSFCIPYVRNREYRTTNYYEGINMSYEYGRDDRREANKWFGLGLGWWVLIVIVAIALTAGIWGLQVATSGVKGQGDAQIEKNSAENWVQAQADFHKYYEGILADDRKITEAAAQLMSNPDDQVSQTNLTGLKNHCQDLVATYNTKAQSFLAKDFRDAGLPAQIDLNNSSTNCKEN